jgi:hypothetical protein
MAGEFLAERLGQGDDAGLRRRIGGGIGIAFLAGDGGDIDGTRLRQMDLHCLFLAQQPTVGVPNIRN